MKMVSLKFRLLKTFRLRALILSYDHSDSDVLTFNITKGMNKEQYLVCCKKSQGQEKKLLLVQGRVKKMGIFPLLGGWMFQDGDKIYQKTKKHAFKIHFRPF